MDDVRAAEPQLSVENVRTAAPQVSVVLPVYRNAAALRELHARLCRTLGAERVSYELVFVDDACPEDSLAVLAELAQSDAHTVVLALERNVGQQRAVMAGLEYARGTCVVVMDADLQDPPEAIPALLGELQRGYAAVFAGRRGRYESPSRLLTSRVFKRLRSLLSRVPPDAGLFVALRRDLVERLLAFDAPQPFIVAMIGCTGLPLRSIPVERAVRPSGTSAYSTWQRLKLGCLTLGWTVVWRLRGGAAPRSAAPVKATYGARFG
jgi:glycosyltransferase involved in cell wall biosynthesis